MPKVFTAKGFAAAKKKKANPQSTFKKPTARGTAKIKRKIKSNAKKATTKGAISDYEQNRRKELKAYKARTTKKATPKKTAPKGAISDYERKRRAGLKAYKKRTTTAPKGTKTLKKAVNKVKRYFK